MLGEKPISYDAIIIGGGLAGLTSAYYLGKAGSKVVVFERQKKAGLLDHPCGGMVGPIKNFVTLEKTNNGIYYKELDFLFENEIILAYPKLMEFYSPDGSKFGMHITKTLDKYAVFQVDKVKLLEIIAKRALKAGVEIKFEHRVSSLIIEQEFIKGVIVDKEEIRSRLVLSAEGLSRKFSNQAGLFSSDPLAYFYIYAKFLSGLELKEDQLGQIGYLGSKNYPLPQSYVIFHSLGYDKAMILLAVSLPEMNWKFEKQISEYMDESISKNPFLQELSNTGSLEGTKGCWMVLQKPDKLISNGFVGMGDSVAPIGHSSIAISMLMGKDAAQLCIKALQKSDVSIKILKEYNIYLGSKIFKGVEFEAKLILTLQNLTDSELNLITDAFSDMNLEPFFVGSSSQVMYATMKLMFKKKIIKNWKIIKTLFR